MTLKELYTLKGEYITQIELYKYKLQQVNAQIEQIVSNEAKKQETSNISNNSEIEDM